MSISSKISVLYLLVVLFSIKKSVWTLSSEADEPPNLCKAKDQPGFELKLRASMLFKKALILIDHNWLVYEVPYSSMNNSYSQLLIDIYAKPIEEYWPAFKTHENWTSIKPNVVSIYSIDVKYPFVYMIASGTTGVCYNLDTATFDKRAPSANSAQVHIISDNGPTQFQIGKNGSHIELFYCTIEWDADHAKIAHTACNYDGFMYYTWNRSFPDQKNITVINDQVEDPSNVISADFGLSDLDWMSLPPGFLYEGKFHFFDYKNVFTFPIGPFHLGEYPGDDDPMPVHATNSVTITPVKDYFKCVHLKLSSNTYPPDPYSLDPGASTDKSSYWIWIVVAIVLLLGIVVIALLVWYFMMGSKGKDSKSRKHSSGNTARTRASSKKDNNFASKQKPSNQGSSKQGNSKQKPSSLKKK